MMKKNKAKILTAFQKQKCLIEILELLDNKSTLSRVEVNRLGDEARRIMAELPVRVVQKVFGLV